MHDRSKRLTEAPSARQFCQIHDDARTLTKAVTDYTRVGLLAGDAVIVTAELARLAALEASLRSGGVHFDDCVRTGQLTLLDAKALLSKIMDGDMPDAQAFHTVVGGVLTAVAARGYRNTRVYGEVVNLLWRDGNPVAAIALEDHWNELAFKYRFSLFCGYEMDELDETAYDGRVLRHFGQDQDQAEHRLPTGQRTMLWLRRNRPGAVGKVVARARVHYGKD